VPVFYVNPFAFAVDDPQVIAAEGERAVVISSNENRVDSFQVVDKLRAFFGDVAKIAFIEVENVAVEDNAVDGVFFPYQFHLLDKLLLPPTEGSKGVRVADMEIGQDKKLHGILFSFHAISIVLFYLKNTRNGLNLRRIEPSCISSVNQIEILFVRNITVVSLL